MVSEWQHQPSLHQVLHDPDGRAPVAAAKVVPVVEVVEQLVEPVPPGEPGRLGNVLVVRRVEGASEAPEHGGDAQLVLRVAVEGGGVEDDRPLGRLAHVAPPQVPVEERGGHGHAHKHLRDLQLYFLLSAQAEDRERSCQN